MSALRPFAFSLAAMILALVRTRAGTGVVVPGARTAPLVKRITNDARIADAANDPDAAADIVLDIADDLCPDPAEAVSP